MLVNSVCCLESFLLLRFVVRIKVLLSAALIEVPTAFGKLWVLTVLFCGELLNYVPCFWYFTS